jgi:hypothetical protein
MCRTNRIRRKSVVNELVVCPNFGSVVRRFVNDNLGEVIVLRVGSSYNE